MATNNSINGIAYGDFYVGDMTISPVAGTVTISNVLNIIGNGENLFILAPSSGAVQDSILWIENKSSDASSDVKISATLDTASTGEIPITFGAVGASNYLGVNHTVSGDPLRYVENSNVYFNAELTGEITLPRNPAFLVYLSSNRTNVTGNGAVVSIFSTNTTEIFDIGSDISNGTFTAPVTAKYHFIASCYLYNIANANYVQLTLVTSNKTYILSSCSPQIYTGGGAMQIFGSAVVDMDAADTATIQLMSSGEAGNTNGFSASGLGTYFAGFSAN